MKSSLFAAFATTLALSAPAFAEGDAEAGEKVFKKCKACHMIASADETIVKGGKVGPNLYGVNGRTAGTDEGQKKYSELMVAAGEKGLAWNEEDFANYVSDPKGFLAEYLGDDADGLSKSGTMQAQRLKDGQAADVWAFIVANGPSE